MAVLLGAVEANGDRSWLLRGDEEHARAALARIRQRAGEREVATWLAQGRSLTLDEAVAAARDALAAAREPLPMGDALT